MFPKALLYDEAYIKNISDKTKEAMTSEVVDKIKGPKSYEQKKKILEQRFSVKMQFVYYCKVL